MILARVNPIRYRGYYYDQDTGLYYLNARYYSPELRRFISPDDTAYLDGETIDGLNLYVYCNNNPVLCSLKHNIAESILSYPFSNIDSYNRTMLSVESDMPIEKSSSTPLANVVSMTSYSISIMDNVPFGRLLGNITHTVTTQHNEAGLIYVYSNIGNTTSSYGFGWNINNWYGISTYVSSNIGIGSSIQITPYFTLGYEISLLDGVSLSFGTISGNVTNETTVSIGWGILVLAYLWGSGLVPFPASNPRTIPGWTTWIAH